MIQIPDQIRIWKKKVSPQKIRWITYHLLIIWWKV